MIEYTEEELLKDYSYICSLEEFKEDNKDLYEDEQEFKEEYLKALVEELEQGTTIISLENGSFLVWCF